ncbi:redoxin domain-containing protein [Terrimonas sp. NA20]|uniref:Redoxin domain-containing protein n=1 Tax=Terrimonas ginsenosidimutans TaxID=2908004 RepID=A0ABS9KUG8_9BACT|nr:redoxin domain-containing protein [Terrimonas ginsenosidimutans]MCG2615945.1 redoxin domain-containing protein [Terrimonas ginsenosidimutans]
MMTFASEAGSAQQLVLEPAMPERGKAVKVIFTPAIDTSGQNLITQADTSVTMVFSSSNFYNTAYRLPMQREGKQWTASIYLDPRYASYATFTLESGARIQKPAKNKHYEIPVYANGVRAKNSFLYENYSLPSQVGKSPEVPKLQRALLEKELELYPDNYEAKVRLLHNKMNSTDGEEKEQYRQQALKVIADNFYKEPGNAGLRDKTTMGYLIIGEKTRVDSIRQVIKTKYPNTPAGYEMLTSEIEEIEDKEERKNKAEALLKTTPAANLENVLDLHQILATYYAEAKNSRKVSYHLSQFKPDTTPYYGPTLLKWSKMLLDNGILPDTALAYTERAYSLAVRFPAGVIRYWPETGYVLPYVDPLIKKQSEQAARANSLSLKALILQKKGDQQKAKEALQKALSLSDDGTTLEYAAIYYRVNKNYENAYQLSKKIVINNQEDTAAQRLMYEDYIDWKKTEEGWTKEMKEVGEQWKTSILATLKKERINKTLPVMGNLVNIKGEPVTPSAMNGKIVVIDFWATWCIPCMKEMPYLQSVYDRYKDNPKVMFMVVNSGSGNTLQDAQNWNGNKKYSFPVFYTDDKMLAENFGFGVIPATFITSTDGNIKFRNIGFEGPAIEYKLATAIELLLSETNVH